MTDTLLSAKCYFKLVELEVIKEPIRIKQKHIKDFYPKAENVVGDNTNNG